MAKTAKNSGAKNVSAKASDASPADDTEATLVDDTEATEDTEDTEASAEPGSEDESGTEKKKRVSPSRAKKVHYPLLQVKEGNATVQISSPEDWAAYNSVTHKPLKKAYFKHLYLFFEFQASGLEAKAAELRGMAENAKALGALADQDTAKRVLQLKASLDKLTATLDEDSRKLLEELMAQKSNG